MVLIKDGTALIPASLVNVLKGITSSVQTTETTEQTTMSYIIKQ